MTARTHSRQLVIALAAAAAVAVAVPGSGPASAASRCRVPALAGITLAKAELRARRAGCRLAVISTPIRTLPPGRHIVWPRSARTVGRQEPARGSAARVVTVWLAPACAQMALSGPPPGSQGERPGITELVTGLYLAGGPFGVFPGRCRQEPPGAGTVTVTAGGGSVVVATVRVAKGALARIPLAPGAYTVAGVFANASVNGQPQHATMTVTITAGTTLRRDLIVALP